MAEETAHKITLFEGIPEPALQEALARLPIRKFPRGMVIFDQGERGEEVFSILSGRVEIVRQSAGAELIQVAVLKAGDVFGEFSYLTGSPRSTAAVALEEVSIAEMSGGWLREMDHRYPDVRDRLIQLYRSRVLTNVLRTTKLFSTLKPNEIDLLASKMMLKQLKDGEEILREGSADLDLIVIKRGEVSISKLKGQEVVRLGKLGPGDVLGEMAVVTGNPRSASAHAVGNCEIMVLPGEDFRQLLNSFPKILQAIEDIVRSRAEQTRKALDVLVQDIVGDVWTDEEEGGGIQVSSLNINVACAAGTLGCEGKLILVSRTAWEFESTADVPQSVKGSSAQLTLSGHKIKDLTPLLAQGPLSGAVTAITGRQVRIALEDPDTESIRIASIVTLMARARVRLFVYPEYNMEKLQVAAAFRLRGLDFASQVRSMSQTACRLAPSMEWNAGEVAAFSIQKGENTILATKALCLSADENELEVQFEYETSEERAALENFLRDISKELGYQQLKAATAPVAKPTASAPVLTRHFRTPNEFLKTYMSSMEAGLIRVESKEKIDRGTSVRVHLAIGGKKGVRRLAFTGLVREWKNGINDIELDDPSGPLKAKVEQLCKSIVEERSEESWQKRKKELAESGVQVAESSPIVKWAQTAGILFVIVAAAWWLFVRPKEIVQAPAPDSVTDAEKVKDATITLETKDGAVTLKASEVTSLRPDPEAGSVTLQAGPRNIEIAQNEVAKLTPFQQRQLEKLSALQKPK